jgi:hypothetical protein
MKRNFQTLLNEYLTLFPCVAIIGPRQCGKTTLLNSLDKSWRKFDLERGSDYQAVADDSDLFLSLHPDRVAIDENRQSMGRFIITALLSHPQAGASWEGMVVEEICRQLNQQGCRFGIVLSNEDQGRMITENIVGLPVRFL